MEENAKLKKSNNRMKAIIVILSFTLVLAGILVFVFCCGKKEEVKPADNQQEEKKEEPKKESEEDIKKTKQSSMKATAQQLSTAVKTVLTANYELYPGTYAFSTGILETGGIDAAFGGKYVYYTPTETDKKIGSGVYKVADKELTESVCKESSYSYIVVTRDEAGIYKYNICLNTTNSGEDGGYLFGTTEQLDNNDNTVFYGKAK